jgi:type IV pilus assembly protein PilP
VILKRTPTLRALTLALLSATVAACGANTEEINQWMDQQRREVKPSVTPLSPPKRFDPQSYLAANTVAPFSNQKLAVAARQDAREPNPLLANEQNRRREPLEAFPLDSMSMVGTLNRNGRSFALLKVDNLLYQVKVGDHMGQNYGRITKVSESEITLREVVQDAAGEWIERSTALQLQDRATEQRAGASR